MSAETSHVLISLGHGHATLLLYSLQSQSKELKHLCYFYNHEFLRVFLCSTSVFCPSFSSATPRFFFMKQFHSSNGIYSESPPLLPLSHLMKVWSIKPTLWTIFWTDFFILSFCCNLSKSISFSAVAFTLFIIRRTTFPASLPVSKGSFSPQPH